MLYYIILFLDRLEGLKALVDIHQLSVGTGIVKKYDLLQRRAPSLYPWLLPICNALIVLQWVQYKQV